MGRGKKGAPVAAGQAGRGGARGGGTDATAGSRPLGATPEALYVGTAAAAAAGAATAVGTGVVLVRVSRNVLSLSGTSLNPVTGLLAFSLLLVFAVSAGVLCGGLLSTLSRKAPRPSGPRRSRDRATAPPPVVAGPSPVAIVLLSAGPFASGSLLTALLGVAVGAVHAAPATWIAAALHATLAGTLCGSGAYLGARKLFRKAPGPETAPPEAANPADGGADREDRAEARAPQKKAPEGGGGGEEKARAEEEVGPR